MIGLNRQFQNRPTLLDTFLLDEGLTILSDGTTQHGLAPLETPDQVVDDKVDTVFIALVVHVEIVEYNNVFINRLFLGESVETKTKRLTAGDQSLQLAAG